MTSGNEGSAKYADDIQRCIICGNQTRTSTRTPDCWIQIHGIRVCSDEHLKAFEEKYYHSLHTPSWYPKAGAA